MPKKPMSKQPLDKKQPSQSSNKELTKELFELDSIILINNGQTYSGIDAISHIINNWGGAYKIIKIINNNMNKQNNNSFKLVIISLKRRMLMS